MGRRKLNRAQVGLLPSGIATEVIGDRAVGGDLVQEQRPIGEREVARERRGEERGELAE